MTYSLVARDPETGDLGVAVQSHFFSVGSAVPWAEPGVGAVATQSFVDISYGPRGLELMRSGRSAPSVLRRAPRHFHQEVLPRINHDGAASRVPEGCVPTRQ